MKLVKQTRRDANAGQGRAGQGRAGRTVPVELVSPTPKEVELRVLPGLYFHRLTDASADTFFTDMWSVAPEADRIGYRYRNGRPLEFIARQSPFGAGSDPSNIVDAGYAYGSIQMPGGLEGWRAGGLEPIILHRNAVSGGGYAMAGTVISADMDRIAQMQPNNKARFVRVTMQEALAARAERHASPESTACCTGGLKRRITADRPVVIRLKLSNTASHHMTLRVAPVEQSNAVAYLAGEQYGQRAECPLAATCAVW